MVRLTKAEREELTREKSLWEAYALARRHLERSPRYAWLAVGAGATTTGVAWWTGARGSTLGDRVREWSSMGFQFAYGVVGILLAGFAIYTTVALSIVAPALAKARNPTSRLSELKTLALHFVETFVPFLIFVGLHLAIGVFGWQGGPAYKASVAIGAAAGFDATRLLAAGMMGLVLGALVYLACCLWVFVFNVYAAFMMMARANITLMTAPEEEDQAEDESARSATEEGDSSP